MTGPALRPRRYVVIGAGAIGGCVGGRLFAGGRAVVLLARGPQYQALCTCGLRLELPGQALELDIPVVDRPEALDLHPEDVLLLAVKTQDAGAAIEALAEHPVAGGGTAAQRLPIVCLQNGVASERMALRHFRRVYAGYVWLPACYLQPGVIEVCCAPLSGVLLIGRFPGGVDAIVEQVTADLAACGFHSLPAGDVMRWKYGKLLENVGNVIEALCGPITGDASKHLLRRAAKEAAAVLDAAGIAYAGGAEQAAVRGDRVCHVVDRAGGSSWQSLARGCGIEVDYLNGEVVMLGRLHDLDTPVNELLQHAAHAYASAARPPGQLLPDDLIAALPGAVSG